MKFWTDGGELSGFNADFWFADYFFVVLLMHVIFLQCTSGIDEVKIDEYC